MLQSILILSFISDSSLDVTLSPTRQVVYIGGNAVITCHSKFDVAPVFTKNGRQLKGYRQKGNTLMILNSKYKDRGHYGCHIPLTMDVSINTAELLVAEKDDTRINPPLGKVDKGKDIVLRCRSLGETRWYFKELNNNFELNNNHSKLLVLNDVQLKDGGIYYCFGIKEKRVIKKVFRYFLSQVQVHVYDNTLIIPTKLRLRYGKSGVFRCLSSNIAPIVWHFNDVPKLPPNVVVLNKSSISIEHFSSTNYGIYVCQGKSWNNYVFYAKGTIQNLVSKRRLSPSFNKVQVGEIVQLLCSSDKETIEWKFNGESLPSHVKTGKYKDQVTNWLIIPSAQITDTGTYTCIEEQSESLAFESNANLIVTDNCPEIGKEQGKIKMLNSNIGQFVPFKCLLEDEVHIRSSIRQNLLDDTRNRANPITIYSIDQSTAVHTRNIVLYSLYVSMLLLL